MYKNKKLLTFMGSITTATIPVAVVVSCGSKEWIYDPDEKLFKNGPSLGDFEKDIDEIDVSDGKTWKILEKQAAFFYYDKEQQGSINVQKDNFLWDKKNKQDQLDNLDKSSSNNKDKIADLKKDIDKIAEKIKKIEDKDLDYKSSSFSTDYPEILLPIKQIKKKQQDIYNNEKKAFVAPYKTRQEGEAAWVSEISKKYDGANTAEEAIENLVYRVIKSNAFLRNNIKIDDTYTVKQLKWANSADADGAFPFLEIDGYDNTKDVTTNISDAINNSKDPSLRVAGNDDGDKVYFYGSDSKIWGHRNEDNFKIFNQTRLQEIVGNKPIYRMYRHVLLNIKPNSKGRTLPWEASIDEIKKLIALQPVQPTRAGSTPLYQFDRIKDLWNGMDDSTDPINNETGFFLNQVSDNSEGTKNIGGSLGIHKASYFSDAMFDGFALGALTIEKNDNSVSTSTNPNFSQDDKIYEKLTNAIKEAKDAILNLNYVPPATGTPATRPAFTSNKAQNDFIDGLNPEQVQNIFGKYIRDVFDPNALKTIGTGNISKGQIGRSLLYTDLSVANNNSDDRFAFISTKDKGGIHLIKRYVVDGTSLGSQAISELEKMANKNTNVSQYNIAELTKPLLTEERLVKKTINDLTTGIGKDFLNFITTKIGKEIKLDDLGIPNINNATDLINNAKDYIINQNVVKANNVASKITNAHYDYLKNALNNEEIAYTNYSTSGTDPLQLVAKEILKPEDIYKIAYKLGKAEND